MWTGFSASSARNWHVALSKPFAVDRHFVMSALTTGASRVIHALITGVDLLRWLLTLGRSDILPV